MMRLLLSLIVLALLQQPVFRTRTEIVRVDALVTDDGVPVAGLTSADFEVRDNGIRQRVTSAGAIEAVQLGVVLDISGSMTGERLEIARAATIELLQQLAAGDRFSIVAFGDQVASIADSRESVRAASASLARMRAAGSTALIDGIYAGILKADADPGPKLLLVMTDGRNNNSWLQVSAIVDVARRHETVVYPVAVGVNRRWTEGVDSHLRMSDSVALLVMLANATGGRLVEADWNRSLSAVFRQILREYRQRYILTFTPEGVSTGDGWHEIEVKVKRRGATVRARPRYWAGKGK